MTSTSILNFATIPADLVGKSIYTAKKAREYVQHDMVLSFLQNEMGVSNDYSKNQKYRHIAEMYPNEQIQIEKYSAMYNHATHCIEVSYSTPKHGYGRIEPPQGLSLSKLHRPTRHALAKDRYVDIDMVNCHVHYFAMVGQALGNKCEALSYYASNPKEVRAMLMDTYQIDKDTAKNLPIRLCYGGDYSYWMAVNGLEGRPYLDMILDMERELKQISQRIYDANPAIREALIATNPDKYRDAGKLFRGTVSAWAQTIERLCQETAIQYLVSKRGLVLEDIIPSQDGFMLLKEYHYEGVLADITRSVVELGIPIQWAEKAFDEAITIPPYDISRVRPTTMDMVFPTVETLIMEANELLYAEAVYQFLKNDLVLTDGHLYVYHGGEWHIDNTQLDLLGKHIDRILAEYFKYARALINRSMDSIGFNSNDMDALKKRMADFLKQHKQLCSDKFNKAIRSKMRGLLMSAGSNIVFDTDARNDYLVHFKNGCYDMKARCFRKRSKFDYIVHYLPYDYLPAHLISREKQQTVLDVFKQIQPDADQRRFQLSYLSYCLRGDATKQVFKMNVGYSGGNGKSTEVSIHSACFPIYTAKLPSKFFEKDYQKRHKDLSCMFHQSKRLVYVEELPTKKLDVSFIKDWVDGRKMPVEVMYGTSRDVRIQAKILTNDNKDPNFGGDADGGLMRRGLIQLYKSRFLNPSGMDAHLINPDTHHYVLNDKLEETFIADDEYKMAYFHLLMQYDTLHIPNTNSEEFRDIMDEQDCLLSKIQSKYELTRIDSDRVSKADMEQLALIIGYSYRALSDKLKSAGCDYKKDLRVSNSSVKGCWVGLKKIQDISSYDGDATDLESITN